MTNCELTHEDRMIFRKRTTVAAMARMLKGDRTDAQIAGMCLGEKSPWFGMSNQEIVDARFYDFCPALERRALDTVRVAYKAAATAAFVEFCEEFRNVGVTTERMRAFADYLDLMEHRRSWASLLCQDARL